MANYSVDTDLKKIRPDILSLGVANWNNQHAEAKAIIDQYLETRWYPSEARDRDIDPDDQPFNPDLLDVDQLKRASCFKTLALVYEHEMTATPEASGFERFRDFYEKRFVDEMQSLMAAGISYDWDEDDSISGDERIRRPMRRLKRC